MKLSPPKNITFWVSVALAVLGLLGMLGVAALAPFAFWLLFVGFVLLALGNLVKGLLTHTWNYHSNSQQSQEILNAPVQDLSPACTTGGGCAVIAKRAALP